MNTFLQKNVAEPGSGKDKKYFKLPNTFCVFLALYFFVSVKYSIPFSLQKAIWIN